MIVYKTWIQKKMRHAGYTGDGVPFLRLEDLWRREGWYLFGLIPLYIRDLEPRGHYETRS